MKNWFAFFKRTRLEKLVAKNQHLGRKMDKLRQERKELVAAIKKELGE